MRAPQLRFSLLSIFVLTAMVAVAVMWYQRNVGWEEAQAEFAALRTIRFPDDKDVARAESLVRRFPPLAREEWAMHWGASHGDVDTLRLFLGAAGDPNAKAEGFGYTPLYYVVVRGDVESVKLLLERGARTDIRMVAPLGRVYDFTLLHAAAEAKHATICRLLIEAGISVNVQDADGETPLHDAVHSLSLPTVRALLEKGAACLPDKQGHSPLYLAALLKERRLMSPDTQADLDEIIRLLESRCGIDKTAARQGKPE